MADTNKETLIQKLTDIADGFRTSRSLTETLSLDEMAVLAAVPITSGENKLPQLVDGTITEITAEDLEGVTKVREYAFHKCTSLTSVTIPDSVRIIGSDAFEDCDSLTSITIGNSVTTIGNYAFSGCNSLTSITIGNSVTTIGNYAFRYCSKLTSITIPSRVTSIGSSALQIGSSTNKATITLLRTKPFTIAINAFNTNFLEKIIVPKGCGEAYKAATNWANFADYIEEATE